MPVPIVSAKLSSSRRAKYRGGIYSVEIDATSVQDVIDAIYAAVSPFGLYRFLRDSASEYFADQIVDRFAYGGDPASGPWAPLESTTLRIRHALGYTDDMAINERTGELMAWVTYSREISLIAGDGAEMKIPDQSNDYWLNQKLMTAQLGATQGPGDMIPGAYTPPRPVLAVDDTDLTALLWLLELHVINYVAGRFRTKPNLP